MPKKPAAEPAKLDQIDAGRQIDAFTHGEHERLNIPPAVWAGQDTETSPDAKYAYDPHIDPSLQWAGKKEGASFAVPTSSIHLHESIKPHKIIRSVQALGNEDPQGWLFESDAERAKRLNDKIEFYQHKEKWTNRLIAGDSLVIMNSLLEKEGMAGQVQCVYIDPPYGIKYGSNFQPFVNKRDVKDKKDEDLSTEPEMIKAFRDTWELGIHSYLSYLRDRLLLAHELLSESGSVFVQISDENVHHVRELCDEVFGTENFINLITFTKTQPLGSNFLPVTCDYLIWYAKDIKNVKYHQLFLKKEIGKDTGYKFIELSDGTRRIITDDESANLNSLPKGTDFFTLGNLASTGNTESCMYSFEFKGRTLSPIKRSWKTHKAGMEQLIAKNRLYLAGNTPMYVQKFSDFPVRTMSNIWDDTRGEMNMQYVVQTANKVIQRCLLMTTDPGDLVLDITCGSGTTACVAEQWGRRWITCDSSRIAITLAKKRLMTAAFDYYRLARPEQGVSGGFVYKTVPHVTLKSIANNEPPEQETLYDQPEIEKRKVRVSGPFTVEALPAPVVRPLDETGRDEGPVPFFNENAAKKQDDWMQELRAAGILGRGGERIRFFRVEALRGAKFLHAEAETMEKEPRSALICFAGETRPLDARMVNLALGEAQNFPKPLLLIFAAFQFDPAAAKSIEDARWPGITLLKALMNIDLTTSDLKKKASGSQSFWLVGQPDVELVKIEKANLPGEDAGKYKVRVRGFDYYDVKAARVNSGGPEKIAMWMLDTDYDGICVEPMQVFFPMEGKNEGWDKLARVLKAELNQDLLEKYRGVESLPFAVKDSGANIAVKIVDDRGIESLKVISCAPARPFET